MELYDAVSSTAAENVMSQSLSKSSGSNEASFHPGHPLLNPVVVDQIVKHLNPDFEQLKTLRLVSKVWTQATHHHWRTSAAVLTLVPEPPTFSKSKYDKGISIYNFLKECSDPQSPFQLSEKPFSKYKLKDFTLDLQVCIEPDTPAFNFWNAVGPLMESVHFYKCLFEKPIGNPSAICPRVQFLVHMIPNLKDLLLTDMSTSETITYYEDEILEEREISEDYAEINDSEVVERWSHFNLRTLTVYGDLRKDMSFSQLLLLAPFLEVIKWNDQFVRSLLKPMYRVRYRSEFLPRALSNLKHLDLIDSMALTHEHFPWNSLEEIPNGSQVPLETLSLQLRAFEEPTGNLDAYLKSLSGTLTTFKVLRAPAGPPYSNFLSDVSMVVLTEMHLIGTIAPHLGFLKGTPNLKKLQVDLGCFEKRVELKQLINKHWTSYEKWNYEKHQEDMVEKVPEELKDAILCSELEVLEVDLEFPEKSLKLLGEWMPDLKILKTILNVETVPIVCEIWKELTELVCLHGSKIENSCFIRAQQQEVVSFPLNPPELKICDLKDLERFQLDAYCDDCKLTDTVVFEGFLKMAGLKSVEICVNSQMSTEAEEALYKGIQFCKVVRDGHDDCGGSVLFGSSFALCDRCTFRREVIYGVKYCDDDYNYVASENGSDEIRFGLGLGSHFVDNSDSREDGSSSSSGNSVNSAASL